MRTLRVLKTSTLSVVSAITLSIRSGCLPLTDRAPESSLRLSLNSCSTVAFIWSPRHLLQSDTGVPHFALDPLTYRCLLSPSPAADFAEPRPPRHIYLYHLILHFMLLADPYITASMFNLISLCIPWESIPWPWYCKQYLLLFEQQMSVLQWRNA